MRWLFTILLILSAFGILHAEGEEVEGIGPSAWRYILFVVIIILGILLSKLVDYLLGVKLKELASRTKTRLDDLIINFLRRPLRIILILGALVLGLSILRIPKTALDYIFCLLIIFVSFLAAKIADSILAGVVKRLTARTKTHLDDAAVEFIRKPLKLIIGVGGVALAIKVFKLPPTAEKLVNNIFKLLFIIVCAYTLTKLMDMLLVYLKDKAAATKSKLDDQLIPVISKSFKIFILVVAVLMGLQNIGINVWSALAALSVGGVAVALAAKETIANFFGSIAIFADRPFRIGDRVQVEGYDGPIESIGLRSTRIRTLDGTLVTIPNARMADVSINNISMRPTIKSLYTIQVTYDTSYEKMKEALKILRDILKKDEGIEDYWVHWKDYGAHSLDILVIFWCKYLKYKEYLEVQERVNLETKKRFEKAGIEFAFPTQTLYVKQGD